MNKATVQLELHEYIGRKACIVDKDVAFDWSVPASLHNCWAIVTGVSEASGIYELEFDDDLLPGKKCRYAMGMDGVKVMKKRFDVGEPLTNPRAYLNANPQV